MSSHNYNMRLNSLTSIEETTPTVVSIQLTQLLILYPRQMPINISKVSKTAILLLNLQKNNDFQI